MMASRTLLTKSQASLNWISSSAPISPEAASRRQGSQGSGGLQGCLLTRVTQLKELGGPLDVGKTAASKLGVHCRIRTTREALRLHACLSATDLSHLVLS